MAKGPEAFRTISEAAEELGAPQHVLRFWETKFSFIRPMKRAGGRRFYRPQDLQVLRGVRALLHDEGYTIKGVQRLHREQGVKRILAAAPGGTTIGAAELAELEAPPAPRMAPPAAPSIFDDALPPGALRRAAQTDQARLRQALGALEAAKAQLDPLLGKP